MAQFDNQQRTVANLTRPVTEMDNDISDGDGKEKGMAFSLEFERCLIELADEAYGLSKPKEIAQKVLRKACEFYDADWCGIFDADMMLKLWMPFWWYNRITGGMTKTRTDMDQYGISGELPRWRNAIEQNTPIIIENVETLKETLPEEYDIFIRQEVKSILAVPFNKRERGVLLLRNPKRYADNPNFLRIMANIVIQEINEQKLLDRMKSETCADCMNDANEVIINLFGGLSVCAERGKLTEAEIKSPLCCKILVLLLMNRKRGMSARELSEHLWADRNYDNPTRNLRSLLFRLRATLRMITDVDLIVTTATGYRINPDVIIKTDFEEFEKICESRNTVTDTTEKIRLLEKAVKLYQGKLFPTGECEHWIIPLNSRCHILYLPLVNELMELLHTEKQYDKLYEYAMLAVSIDPESPITIYWLIVALRKHGAADMAKRHLESAKLRLLEEEYRDLEARLILE